MAESTLENVTYGPAGFDYKGTLLMLGMGAFLLYAGLHDDHSFHSYSSVKAIALGGFCLAFCLLFVPEQITAFVQKCPQLTLAADGITLKTRRNRTYWADWDSLDVFEFSYLEKSEKPFDIKSRIIGSHISSNLSRKQEKIFSTHAFHIKEDIHVLLEVLNDYRLRVITERTRAGSAEAVVPKYAGDWTNLLGRGH